MVMAFHLRCRGHQSAGHHLLSTGVALEDVWFTGLDFTAVLVEDVIAAEDIGSRRTGIAT